MLARKRERREANKKAEAARVREWRETNKEAKRAGDRKYREANKETIAAYKREYQQTPKGREVHNKGNRTRREREAGAEYIVLHTEDVTCYICGTDQGPFEIEHVIPVSKAEPGIVSATRLACKDCNRAKSDKPLAVFLLERLRGR
jgi:5-methylcytosine-specific restriction endonuclease McrA